MMLIAHNEPMKFQIQLKTLEMNSHLRVKQILIFGFVWLRLYETNSNIESINMTNRTN